MVIFVLLDEPINMCIARSFGKNGNVGLYHVYTHAWLMKLYRSLFSFEKSGPPCVRPWWKAKRLSSLAKNLAITKYERAMRKIKLRRRRISDEVSSRMSNHYGYIPLNFIGSMILLLGIHVLPISRD